MNDDDKQKLDKYERRATGHQHHRQTNRDNPVQYSRHYWLKVYLLIVGVITLLYLIAFVASKFLN